MINCNQMLIDIGTIYRIIIYIETISLPISITSDLPIETWNIKTFWRVWKVFFWRRRRRRWWKVQSVRMPFFVFETCEVKSGNKNDHLGKCKNTFWTEMENEREKDGWLLQFIWGVSGGGGTIETTLSIKIEGSLWAAKVCRMQPEKQN